MKARPEDFNKCYRLEIKSIINMAIFSKKLGGICIVSKPLIISKRPWAYVVGASSLCLFGLMALFVGIEGRLGYQLWWILIGIALFIIGAILMPFTLRIRKVMLDNTRFQYWVGKKKKFDALWSEISHAAYVKEIVSSGHTRMGYTYSLTVMANDEDITIDEAALGSKDELEKINNYILEKKKEYDNISIERNNDWLIEKRFHYEEGKAKIKNALFPPKK